MPFAQLPSSPGFQAPQAPSWAPFALQANENIQKGGEMRMAAGKELSDSIQQAATQIDSVIKENSPEAKLQRALKMELLKAQKDLYTKYQQNPQAFEFKNGMLQYKDPYTNLMKGVQFSNAIKNGKLLDKRLNPDTNPYHDWIRQQSLGAPVSTQQLSAPVLENTGSSDVTNNYNATSLDTGGVGNPYDGSVDVPEDNE